MSLVFGQDADYSLHGMASLKEHMVVQNHNEI